MKRRRRKGTQFKFFVRRFVLALIVLAAVGGAVWFVAAKLGQPGAVENDVSEEPGSEPEESLKPPQSPPESQFPEEPEPEPIKAEDAWKLILLNADYPLPDDFVVPELETISGEYKVDARTAPFLRKMIADAKLEGISLMVTSAYRSPDYQQTLFQKQIEQQRAWHATEEEAVAAASAVVLPPGTSEHHTGLAVDIVTPDYQTLDEGFAATPAAKWMAENAWKYGYILRYPEDKQDITNIIYEPWHMRFVGEENAKAIKESGVCLEEYLIRTAFVGASENGRVSVDNEDDESSDEQTVNP